MSIIFTPHFKRSYKKLVSKNEKLKNLVHERIRQFEKDPSQSSLEDHALTGKLKECRAFSIGYDLRAIYKRMDDKVLFFDIGTHDQVYR